MVLNLVKLPSQPQTWTVYSKVNSTSVNGAYSQETVLSQPQPGLPGLGLRVQFHKVKNHSFRRTGKCTLNTASSPYPWVQHLLLWLNAGAMAHVRRASRLWAFWSCLGDILRYREVAYSFPNALKMHFQLLTCLLLHGFNYPWNSVTTGHLGTDPTDSQF